MFYNVRIILLLPCISTTSISSESFFQVRINAALALGSVSERAILGDKFQEILSGLLLSMEKAYSLEVFGEYQHQAGLIDQLSLTTCQLFALADRYLNFCFLVKCFSMLCMLLFIFYF